MFVCFHKDATTIFFLERENKIIPRRHFSLASFKFFFLFNRKKCKMSYNLKIIFLCCSFYNILIRKLYSHYLGWKWAGNTRPIQLILTSSKLQMGDTSRMAATTRIITSSSLDTLHSTTPTMTNRNIIIHRIQILLILTTRFIYRFWYRCRDYQC